MPADGAADDLAIAVDKAASRPGQMATFANYTSYSRGINGLMVDLGARPGRRSCRPPIFSSASATTIIPAAEAPPAPKSASAQRPARRIPTA